MIRTSRAAPDIDVITSNVTIPGFGLVPVNAFVLHGPEPILVDTGSVVETGRVHGRTASGHRPR